MKKIFLTLLAALFIGLVSDASVAVNDPNVALEELRKDKKKKVDPNDLPDDVKETLKGADYNGWLIHEAWRVKPKGKKKHYEIHLKMGEELKIVNIDPDGKVLKDKFDPGE